MMAMPADILTLRQLNRATLARQMLLARRAMPIVDAVEQLLALQAQVPRPPFVSLWSRLQGFERTDFVGLLEKRRLVRATTMRGTLHVMSTRDYQKFRATLQAGLATGLKILGQRMDGLDVARLVEQGRRFFATPRSFESFRDHLLEGQPGGDARAMAYAVRLQLPLVQVPSGGTWGYPTNPEFVAADAWVGKAGDRADHADALVQRYLAALGPAGAVDVQTWCGLPGARAALERLRPTLRVFKGEGRTELFDLPDAPRPGEDEPAPIRFLPEWDSAIVSRVDARFVKREHRSAVFRPGLRVLPTLLVDGMVAATWKTERKRTNAALTVEPFSAFSKRVREQVEEEASALLRFVEADASRTKVQIR
jgi:hypothetical protein